MPQLPVRGQYGSNLQTVEMQERGLPGLLPVLQSRNYLFKEDEYAVQHAY